MSRELEALTPRGLERRLKRHLRKVPQAFAAVCAPGLERVLADEVAALARFEPGIVPGDPETGVVPFEGPIDAVYPANLRLRTATRVRVRIAEPFLAQTRPMLYDHARKVAWERWLGFANAYGVSVSVRASRLTHRASVAATLGDAIASATEPLGLSPRRREDAPLRFLARLHRDRCTLSFDSSGEPLYRRGLRTRVGEAPLRETLAAGMLLHAGLTDPDGGEDPPWDAIVDPFCGTGALLVEAGLILSRTPPGAARSFAFEHAPWFQASKWRRIRDEATGERRELRTALVGIDLAPDAVRAAGANLEAAGLEAELRVGDALEQIARRPEVGRGLLVSNLPYGRRVGRPAEVEALLRSFFGRLREACPGWDYAFLTAHPELLDEAGLAPAGRVALANGGLAVTLALGQVP